MVMVGIFLLLVKFLVEMEMPNALKFTSMVFAKPLDKLAVLEREYREWANYANFPESIRAIHILA